MKCKHLLIWGRALNKEMPDTIKAVNNNAVKIANKMLKSEAD